MTSPASPWDVPDLVGSALRESLRIGYLDSTRSETGRLLATLAASRTGTIADLGTGCGVGAAWLRTGASAVTRVVTVERDPRLARSAARLFAGTGIEVLAGDWRTMDWAGHDVAGLSLVTLDMETARDARDRLVDLLAPGALLVLDDPHPWQDLGTPRDGVALQGWMHDGRLLCCEVSVAPDAGVLLCTRI
ncbi:cytidine deaminase [Raineyella sp. W15-4]|uniref:O-methyltransferase n=1 Tax=Raineyella sp. W15-4 TaxID=3081651 RepID=UPI0029540DC4|nr:cytidine deaminase [Raineyella sp. W15-4]WOQ18435.1 cytidine deaminase [Raineyella sp. W15-4]